MFTNSCVYVVVRFESAKAAYEALKGLSVTCKKALVMVAACKGFVFSHALIFKEEMTENFAFDELDLRCYAGWIENDSYKWNIFGSYETLSEVLF